MRILVALVCAACTSGDLGVATVDAGPAPADASIDAPWNQVLIQDPAPLPEDADVSDACTQLPWGETRLCGFNPVTGLPPPQPGWTIYSCPEIGDSGVFAPAPCSGWHENNWITCCSSGDD